MPERRALVITYHTPQHDRDSGSRRVFHFIDLLQKQGWELAVLAADGLGPRHDTCALAQRGVAVYDGYRTTIDEIFDENTFELVLIAYWPNADRYLARVRWLAPSARIIVDSVDLHFLRESRETFRYNGHGPIRNLNEGHGSRFAAELNMYASADGVLTVSNKEADLINDLAWDASLARPVPDFEELALSFEPFGRRRGVVCVGSFEHPPNIDAIAHLCRDIWPLLDPAVRKEHPLWVVGNGMDDRVRKLALGLDDVHMIGWVPSVVPYLARARISVVSLLYGAGTKRKLVQALATGTPTVSTSIGAEGLGVQHGEHLLIADDPADFAASMTSLLRDAALWSKLARAGQRHVGRTNGRALAAATLADSVAAVFCRPPKPAPIVRRNVPQHRLGRDEYEDLVARLQQKLPRLVRSASNIVVISRGDGRLLDGLNGKAGHFPQDESGEWAGYHPEDGRAAVEHLKALRARGAEVLVIPKPSFWWLDHYEELATYLFTAGSVIHRDEDCEIFALVPGRRRAESRDRQDEGTASIPEPPPSQPDGVKAIAFYLPQFHPIPQNDQWWGEGFTEWRSVARAEPQFPGHYQPRVPADLGFYDLRLAETREHQAELARSYGIHGFCYYHYWFSSKRLLERPFDEVLSSGRPDFPFALCWANDPWSRRWDGRHDDLLQPQTYSPEDDVAHIRWLLPALGDPRAITVGGKPIFLVYRGRDLPDPARTIEMWRDEVDRAGLPGIHLIAVESAWDLGWDATQVGFDAKVLFQPQFGWLITHLAKHGGQIPVPGKDDLQVYDFDAMRAALRELAPAPYRRYESLCPGWDNSARVGDRAVVLHNATPAGYESWLCEAIERARGEPVEHRLVFINAWNEWAEGCHLEPDLLHGRAYLEATRRALLAPASARSRPSARTRVTSATKAGPVVLEG